jgi:hypothetical protein
VAHAQDFAQFFGNRFIRISDRSAVLLQVNCAARTGLSAIDLIVAIAKRKF